MPTSSSVKESPKFAEAMTSTNWRQPAKPSYEGSRGFKVHKKRHRQAISSDFNLEDPSTHLRSPEPGASPQRSASSIGFSADSFFDISEDANDSDLSDCSLFHSNVGIISSIPVTAATAASRFRSSTERASRAFADHAHPRVHVIDVVMVDDYCQEKMCRTHDGDFPIAEIESIRGSKRFKATRAAAKMYEQEKQEREEEAKLQYTEQVHQTRTTPRKESVRSQNCCGQNAIGSTDKQPLFLAPRKPNIRSQERHRSSTGSAVDADSTAQAIMSDSAVVNVGGVRTRPKSDPITDPEQKRHRYNCLIEKLSKATKEKKIQDMLGIGASVLSASSDIRPTPTGQTVSRRNHPKSDDSAVVLDMDRPSSPRPSPTGLNPAAKEFVARSTTDLADPAIVGIGKPAGEKQEPEATATTTTTTQKAVVDAMDMIAEYTKSYEKLQEVVKNTIQKFGFPGLVAQEVTAPPSPATFPLPMGTMVPSRAGPAISPVPFQGYPSPPFTPSCGPGDPSFAGLNGLPPLPPGLRGPMLPPQMVGRDGPVPLPMNPAFPGATGYPGGQFMTPNGLMPPPCPPGTGPMLPPGLLGPMASLPPPPSYWGPFAHPPPGCGPGLRFGPGPFVPRLSHDGFVPPPLMPQTSTSPPGSVGVPGPGGIGSKPVRKPRAPDAQRQLEYEAHIEWRKANEPGYAQLCQERQNRRAQRSMTQKTGGDQKECVDTAATSTDQKKCPNEE
ncbi:hypothetical protein SODALDRAFT_331509 [Sodiomyces alkalinus F11]|uniref:Uncharacterized protein n=1 Tax=Sodiomyces alkalinus (strain CBS 110278 / VKM F-3762 / F11) TaxID=1314773 RepID=A0A3N2Q4Q3_SODAK|nr:hypothetical protein SODALDRAFT_331509 [Sodiomyces alkalinus F11]ROT41732.1 hypothetical protein SODALDRAFT_331509 [Sodiomyces alkalinus F11]